jgi:hypothetical protein
MKLFEFEFSLEEVQQLSNTILNRINEDRNNLCLLLHSCNEFIKDWYNEINTMFIPMVIKGSFNHLGDSDKTKLALFITNSPYLPVSVDFRHHFNKVYNDWNRGGLSKIINDSSDANKLIGVIEYLQRFEDFAIHKNDWYRRAISWDVDINLFKEWQYELWQISLKMNDIKLDLGDSFNCQYNKMKNFVQEHKKSKH